MSASLESTAELRRFNYPAELFGDLSDKIYREHPDLRRTRMAKYAIMQHLELPFTEERILEIAKDKIKGRSFFAAIRYSWGGIYGNANGLENADIELAADELGVLELIAPLDEEKVRAAAEEEALYNAGMQQIDH